MNQKRIRNYEKKQKKSVVIQQEMETAPIKNSRITLDEIIPVSLFLKSFDELDALFPFYEQQTKSYNFLRTFLFAHTQPYFFNCSSQ